MLRSQEVLLREKRTDSGTSGSAIAELDSFDAQFRPIMSAVVQRAQDNQNPCHFPGTNGAPGPIASILAPSSELERAINYDATKDPRVRDARASL